MEAYKNIVKEMKKKAYETGPDFQVSPNRCSGLKMTGGADGKITVMPTVSAEVLLKIKSLPTAIIGPLLLL